MNTPIAAVFGGTGFVGRQIVRELARDGYIVKVATRVPEHAYFLKTCGAVGQVVPLACRYDESESITRIVEGSSVVVNCIGTLFERGKKQTFQKIHIDTPSMIAAACSKVGVRRFVHISALGVDTARSKYAQTKLRGEQAVLTLFPKAIILRPSVIFGEDDAFFNRFANLARFLPALPLIGGGKTRFQPIFVGDVADAVVAALHLPAFGPTNPQGRIFELGGPEILTFKEIYETLFLHSGQRRCLINLPFSVASLQSKLMSFLPNPPLTPDQVESLKTDSVVKSSARTLADLGLTATAMDSILPSYIGGYRAEGRFSGKTQAKSARAV